MHISPIMLNNSAVHDFSPDRREPGDQHHQCVATRQLWSAETASQGLVSKIGVRMMIAVALQIEQQKVSGQVVRISAVLRRASYVTAARRPLPQQTVMFDVVHRFQQCDPTQRLDRDERKQLGAEKN